MRPIRLLSASRGKVQRAEPVAALYAQGKVRHVGHFPQLERQILSRPFLGIVADESIREPDRGSFR